MCAHAVRAPAGPDAAELRGAILGWYERSGRQLAFRRTTDPYAVLVSETMAQQTQISRVEPAWERFMATFPTIAALAAATPADVLRAWQGLGYNRRALNLQRAARAMVAEYGGEVPRSIEALERLPGIGPYTARAVAAIAFGQAVGAVDTNVRRVLGRIVDGAVPPPGDRRIQAIADELVPATAPGPWTHALMDLGAAICRPSRPLCPSCPTLAFCRFAAGSTAVGEPRPASTRSTAGPCATARSASPIRFEETTRWLRGRILDRLREADGAAWARLDGSIGSNSAEAVRSMLGTLAAEGLIEVDPIDPTLARLPR